MQNMIRKKKISGNFAQINSSIWKIIHGIIYLNKKMRSLDKVTKLIPKVSDINFVALQIIINAIPYRSVH